MLRSSNSGGADQNRFSRHRDAGAFKHNDWISVSLLPLPRAGRLSGTMLVSGPVENLVNRCWSKWGHLVGLDARKRMLGRYLFARYGGSIVLFGRFVALLRAFAAMLAGAGLAPWRFFVFNALGGITWATVFGLGGYLLSASIHRIAGPVGWLMLGVAVLAAVLVWRYFKHHEERLLAAAEFEQAKYERR